MERGLEREHVGQAGRFPELASGFDASLELAAGGFHSAGPDGAAFGRQRLVVQMLAMSLEIHDFALQQVAEGQLGGPTLSGLPGPPGKSSRL